jgi:hypothetical protein
MKTFRICAVRVLRTWLMIAVLACWPFYVQSADVVDLFILAGQSNMQGYMGDASKFPPGSSITDLSIPFYYVEPVTNGHDLAPKPSTISEPRPISAAAKSIAKARQLWSDFRRGSARMLEWPPAPVPRLQWTYLGPQWGRFPGGHFGPEVSFARKLLEDEFHPAIFKYSKESTSLADDWKGPGEGGLYDDFLKTLRNAISELNRAGYSVKIRGLVWIQGENDALTEEAADRYFNRLQAIIRDLRQEILTNRTPVILGADEMHPHMALRPQVKAAQEAMTKTEPCVIRSSMQGLEKADFTHLTPESLVEHGLRLYRSYRQIAAGCSSPPG